MLERLLEELKDAVNTAPHPALKLAAMYLMLEYDRDKLPDWVEALANGNLENWDAVIEVVKDDIEYGGGRK